MLIEHTKDFLGSLVTSMSDERTAVRMAASDIDAVFEQHTHGVGFAAIHHAHQRCLPVLRFGIAGEALCKGPVERRGVAREDVGNAIEPIVVECIKKADRTLASEGFGGNEVVMTTSFQGLSPGSARSLALSG